MNPPSRKKCNIAKMFFSKKNTQISFPNFFPISHKDQLSPILIPPPRVVFRNILELVIRNHWRNRTIGHSCKGGLCEEAPRRRDGLLGGVGPAAGDERRPRVGVSLGGRGSCGAAPPLAHLAVAHVGTVGGRGQDPANSLGGPGASASAWRSRRGQDLRRHRRDDPNEKKFAQRDSHFVYFFECT